MTVAHTPRETCPRCRRPVVVCYCAHVTPIETRTRVLVLQHPRERDVAINTARIAALCLPQCELVTAVHFDEDPTVRAALQRASHPPVLLYPGPDSRDLREQPPEGPVTLVVLDGTWSQAGKLLRENPFLASLPQYRLAPEKPSNYRIRKEPEEHCVATIEALAEVLGVLEGDRDRMQGLLRPFEAMVDRQIEYARSLAGGGARHARARAKAAARPRPVPRGISPENLGRVVCVYGEANAWPYDYPNKPPAEIIHWVAERAGSGERFESVLAPRQPLCSTAHIHARLSQESVMAGEAAPRFYERWCAFLRPDDILVCWGPYAPDVLHKEGFALAPRLDLRVASSHYLADKPGALEDLARERAAEELAPESTWLQGRAGERLACFSAVTRAMAKGTLRR